jgi:ATP adenylyltransferase
MKRIWAPWRMDYIKGEMEESGCMFCNRLAMRDGPENLILYRGQRAFVILNRFPYTNGHMMVVPIAHEPTLEPLEEETLTDLMVLTRKAVLILKKVYSAKDFNIGINIGEVAGAGIVDHVHIHIVPRWPGDTSFMSTTASTRVIPEALEESYNTLHEEWLNLKNTHPG